jgi:hypothetical protein
VNVFGRDTFPAEEANDYSLVTLHAMNEKTETDGLMGKKASCPADVMPLPHSL